MSVGGEPAVDRPDSVTHYYCPAPGADGRTHHINHHGVCAWCKVPASELRDAHEFEAGLVAGRDALPAPVSPSAAWMRGYWAGYRDAVAIERASARGDQR